MVLPWRRDASKRVEMVEGDRVFSFVLKASGRFLL